MIERLIDSPMPMPLGLVVKKASNMRCILSGSIPVPESCTTTSTWPASRCDRISSSRRRSPTAAMASMPFITRLMSTCCSCTRSPRTGSNSGARSSRNDTSWPRSSVPMRATMSSIVAYDVHGEVAPEEGAVFPAVALFDVVVVALATQEIREEAPVRRRILRVCERREGHASELVCAVTQHLLEFPITFEGPAGRVAQCNTDRRLFEERAKLPLASAERFLGALPLGDVVHDRHEQTVIALRARDQRHMDAHPHQGAVLAPVALYQVEGLPFALQQLVGKPPVGFTILLVRNVHERQRAEFLRRVTQHSLIGSIGGQDSATAIARLQHDADGRVLEDGPEPLFALSQLLLIPSSYLLVRSIEFGRFEHVPLSVSPCQREVVRACV